MLRCLALLLRYQACVVATRVHSSCVCDLCRVRVLVRLSHPRPSVITAPVYRGCPAGTHWCDPVSLVRPDQSANSCCACLCVVVRRTRRRVVCVESPDVTFVGFPPTPSSTWLRLWPCRSSWKPRTTCGSLHSLSRLISIRLAGWTFCWLRLRHELLCMN